ncbi:WxL protein peptidoglycan domain-containing protein [Dactylosporangium salmoneum]|uniref:WxL Interacting Protein peptidoglycan binding domain-containing protein n=1 Tax=Dactylosporangium salmoneum TaxID=53361 RepID=A0ABN3H254_9ACTN
MTKRTAASACAGLILLALLPAPASAAPVVPARLDDSVSWGVTPAVNTFGSGRAHFDYTLDAGASLSDAMVVANHSAKAITLRVYASDAFTTHNGGIDLLPTGAKSTDVGIWVKAESDSVTLQPGQSATVPFTLSVPTNATPGDHSGGLVTTLVDEAGANGVRVEHRLGSRVYVRVNGALHPALTVADIHADYSGTINPAGTGSVRVSYTVRNTGNVRLSAGQSVTVEGPFGLLSRDAAVANLPEILPGNALTNTVTVTGVWPATRMTAQIKLTPVASGGSKPVPTNPESGSASLWAPPWGQLIVLVVIAGLVVGVITLRRRQKRRMDAVVAAAVAKALKESQGSKEAKTAADPA